MAATATEIIKVPPDIVGPDYNIQRYTATRFKVTRFKSTALRSGYIPRAKEEGFKHIDKLPQAISRAKRVCLEIALCNDWKWFATFTIAKDNFDRKNLEGFYKRFKEWLKYQREKYGVKIPYLLVPEQHGDGSWHMHGFFNSDIDQMLVSFRDMDKQGYRSPDGKKLPRKLIKKNYYNWPAYQKRFGFCSFGEIRNHDAAAFYVTKYISKSFHGDARRVGLQLYYATLGLNRSEYYDSIYGPCPPLDACLVNHYEWCSTGFWCIHREPGDDPLLDIIEEQQDVLYPMSFDEIEPEVAQEVDDYYDITQLYIDGF